MLSHQKGNLHQLLSSSAPVGLQLTQTHPDVWSEIQPVENIIYHDLDFLLKLRRS